ncbi:helix-turn-helix domain-containing protein [Citrobacter freundii]|nr:helix-turn-helix domain-containing protein [Citrobacter freundii]
MTHALKDKITSIMSQSEIAKKLGVKSQAVSGWLNFTGIIPADRVIPLSQVLGWKITPHELRPDIYPNHTDGLPPRLEHNPRKMAGIEQ